MKKDILILLLFLDAGHLLACLSASQNRLFPLGETSQGLCMVEMRLYRTSFREKKKEAVEMNPAWGGEAYFKIYDQNYNQVYSELLDSIEVFLEHGYDSITNL